MPGRSLLRRAAIVLIAIVVATAAVFGWAFLAQNSNGTARAILWMDADTVAREGIDALERGEVVHVAGRANRAIKTLTQLMPDRWALRLVQKRSKDFRKT